MDDDERSIEYTWTLPELLGVARWGAMSHLPAAVLLAALGLAAIADDGPHVVTLLLVIWPVVVLAHAEIATRRRWRTVASLQQPERLEWTDEVYEITDASSSSKVSYGLIRSVSARGQLVRWHLRTGQLQAVPISAFVSTAQQADFVACVEAGGAAAAMASERRRGRWVLAALVVVLALLVALLLVTDRPEPSRPDLLGAADDLARAVTTWQASGPHDYDLVYRITYPELGSLECEVKVRDRGIAAWTGAGSEECLEPRTMEGLHEYVDAALDRQPDAVEGLVLVASTGALASFSVDEDGTPEGRWSISVLELTIP